MKFLTDSMFGKLTRFLRIFGYDTVYANDLTNLFNIDPVPDDYLIEYANDNNRIIITKDLPLYQRYKDKSIFLKGEGIYNYLNQLNKQLGLKFEFNFKKARCSICNSILEKIVDKRSIVNEIESETFHNYDDFYRCTNPKCNKIYWKGSHIDKIIIKLKKKA